ncbi:TIGR03618 family F420-dependent PPOX class oxidoreductase [Saccharomonospora saliphila]|uniref:TIGR03618 family F420-dependent PPOX class oxidoreductase n=1 Tax=Saccharomonospora saliphila TaxID=369829 RepID=UPI0003A9981B|nr:TIGR03618 family F420-dependent PPOX class oxidoreductase [Saccharomonospora saliphila]
MAHRERIRMSPGEVSDYLAARRVITLATTGPNGRPHLAPLWYVPREEGVASWTYGKSQKVVNLRRDPRATVLVESGDRYDELRGVSMECDVELVTDLDAVTRLGLSLAHRYTPDADDATLRRIVAAQAPKRVGLICRPTRTVSWDHAKLRDAH